jgi:hypothetical protein
MTKWNLPLTYAPKIRPVIDGTCRQTIRTGRKFCVGDLVRFYTWAGRPYHSKRMTVTEYIKIHTADPIQLFPYGVYWPYPPANCLWEDDYLNEIASKDGIVPPTGEALRDVLMSKNKIPATGIDAQIVRW